MAKSKRRRLHTEELYDLCSPLNSIWVINSRMRWAGHVARMGKRADLYRILVGRPEGKGPLGNPRRRRENNITFFVALRPNAGHDLLILEVSRSHSTTHYFRQDSSGRVISSSQRPLPDNTQHSQQTYIPAPGGIRTHDLSRRAAADLRLRPRGHWDWDWYLKELGWGGLDWIDLARDGDM